MRRFSAHTLGIDQGNVQLFSDFEDGGPMWTGHGPREKRVQVMFSEPFLDTPVVTLTVSMWDLGRETNARADLSADDIRPDGFTIVFRTWGDTRVARVRSSWMAMGPLRDEDQWDLG